MIRDPFGVAEELWRRWLREHEGKAKEGRLEVDPETLHHMRADYGAWNYNVERYMTEGAVYVYRGTFTITAFGHIDPPNVNYAKIEGPIETAVDFHAHMALAFIGKNGRWNYLNWEGNHEDYN